MWVSMGKGSLGMAGKNRKGVGNMNKHPISNQNFIAWIEQHGFNRDIDFIRETDNGIVISIGMLLEERDEMLKKFLLPLFKCEKCGKIGLIDDFCYGNDKYAMNITECPNGNGKHELIQLKPKGMKP
jgi:hypothetical protein